MLHEGMRLSQEKFRALYEKSDLRKAELVKGKVRMPSPVTCTWHGSPHSELHMCLSVYKVHSRNVQVCIDTTVNLDAENEVQPDVLMRKIDGACREDENGYLHGPPELVAEISNTSANFDSNEKKEVYEKCGVKEYIIWHTKVNRIDWFVLQNGRYCKIEPVDGLLTSETFPGLVLNLTALMNRNSSQVFRTLMTGLNER